MDSARVAARALCTALSIALAPAAALAQPSSHDADLDAIREHIQFARYDEAAGAADALARSSGVDARRRNTALELLATAHIAAGRDADATEVLRLLYARDPDHRLSDRDASPRVQGAFARARERSGARSALVLQQRARAGPRREAPLIEARLPDAVDTVDEMHLAYRQGGDREYTRVVMTRREDGAYSARIPVLSVDGPAYDVAYYVEALAPSGAVLGSVGGPDDALSLEVPSGSAQSSARGGGAPLEGGSADSAPSDGDGGGVATKWWFWTLIVLVVGGAAATTAILLGPAQGPPDGSLGGVQLTF